MRCQNARTSTTTRRLPPTTFSLTSFFIECTAQHKTGQSRTILHCTSVTCKALPSLHPNHISTPPPHPRPQARHCPPIPCPSFDISLFPPLNTLPLFAHDARACWSSVVRCLLSTPTHPRSPFPGLPPLPNRCACYAEPTHGESTSQPSRSGSGQRYLARLFSVQCAAPELSGCQCALSVLGD